MSYGKLVRDRIPEIITNNGEKPITRVLSNEEYKIELENKLLEECREVINSSKDERIEELADLLEVMIALGKIEGKTLEEILIVRESKKIKRGGFDKMIYLCDVEKNK